MLWEEKHNEFESKRGEQQKCHDLDITERWVHFGSFEKSPKCASKEVKSQVAKERKNTLSVVRNKGACSGGLQNKGCETILQEKFVR